jgi:sulfate transport system substrate-binding protein
VLRRRLARAGPGLGVLGLLAFAVWPWVPRPHRPPAPRTVIVYGFSILAEVMNEAIFPAFQARWRAQTGERVELISAFAGSGTVTNQLVMGVPADLALLSLELDALRLAENGVVAPGSWRRLPHRGVVNRTPFVILVRPGNPKHIADFEDLTRPGVGIVHADPLTSGGASWAIIAEYGAGQRRRPEDLAAGVALLRGVWHNVVAQSASARAARTQFENGFGDALITYEQDALADRVPGRPGVTIVYPASTVLSEHTLVVVDRNVEPDERALVDAFTRFLWSREAQQLFVRYGFRSVDEALNAGEPAFGRIADPFVIGDLGGWERAKREIVDRLWKDQVLKELGR